MSAPNTPSGSPRPLPAALVQAALAATPHLHPVAPSRTAAHPHTQNCETNPPPPNRQSAARLSSPKSIGNRQSLKPAQLAALHLLLAGHRPTAVAARLNLSRHTIWRWKKLPAFQHHARQLARDLYAPARRPPLPATPTPVRSQRPF